MKRGQVLAGIVVVGLLSGCGAHDVDQAAWKADLRNAGFTSPNMPKLADLYVNKLCKDDTGDLALFLAAGADARQLDMDLERLNFKHACPDRLDMLADAAKRVQDSGRAADGACAVPAEKRTDDQALLAEAMGC